MWVTVEWVLLVARTTPDTKARFPAFPGVRKVGVKQPIHLLADPSTCQKRTLPHVLQLPVKVQNGGDCLSCQRETEAKQRVSPMIRSS